MFSLLVLKTILKNMEEVKMGYINHNLLPTEELQEKLLKVVMESGE